MTGAPEVVAGREILAAIPLAAPNKWAVSFTSPGEYGLATGCMIRVAEWRETSPPDGEWHFTNDSPEREIPRHDLVAALALYAYRMDRRTWALREPHGGLMEPGDPCSRPECRYMIVAIDPGVSVTVEPLDEDGPLRAARYIFPAEELGLHWSNDTEEDA